MDSLFGIHAESSCSRELRRTTKSEEQVSRSDLAADNWLGCLLILKQSGSRFVGYQRGLPCSSIVRVSRMGGAFLLVDRDVRNPVVGYLFQPGRKEM